MRKRNLIVSFISILVVLAVVFIIFNPFTSRESQEGPVPQAKRALPIIAIFEHAPHPLFDELRNGFTDGLRDNGFLDGKTCVIDFQSAQSDQSAAQAIVTRFVSKKPALIYSMGTQASQLCANATKDIPIVFGAVTDPVTAGLCENLEKPGGNITGSMDVWPYEKQIKLLLAVKPEVKKLAMVFNPGEANSVASQKIIKRVCADLGIEVLTRPASNTGEVYQSATSLVGKVDAFYVGADNTAISAVESIIKAARTKKLPVLAGEKSSVKRGAILTHAVSYYQIGRANSEQALAILRGTPPGDIPVMKEGATTLVVNLQAAKEIGIEMPQEILDQKPIEIISE